MYLIITRSFPPEIGGMQKPVRPRGMGRPRGQDKADQAWWMESIGGARNEFGFMRMWSIYPTQVEAIVEALKPDYSEVEDAQGILLAAQQANWGPIQYKGELHDRATYRYFWQLLQRANVSGLTLSEEIRKAFFSEKSVQSDANTTSMEAKMERKSLLRGG